MISDDDKNEFIKEIKYEFKCLRNKIQKQNKGASCSFFKLESLVWSQIYIHFINKFSDDPKMPVFIEILTKFIMNFDGYNSNHIDIPCDDFESLNSKLEV